MSPGTKIGRRNGRERSLRGAARAVVVLGLLPWGDMPAVRASGEVPTLEEARAHYDRGDDPAALEAARAFLDQVAGRTLEAAEAMDLAARAMTMGRLGERREALRYAERALAIRRRLLQPGDPELAAAEYLVGFVHYKFWRPRKAVPHFEAALRIAEATHGEEHPELERYVRERGATLYEVGRFEEARGAFERLHRISADKYGQNDPRHLPSLFNLAMVSKNLSDFERAEGLYADAIRVLEAQDPLDVDTYTRVLKSRATMLHVQGHFSEALELGEQALELRRKHHGEDDEGLAQALNDVAVMYLRMGIFEPARRHLEESLERQEGVEVEPLLRVLSRTNLARVHRAQGDLEAAKALFDEARGLLDEQDHAFWGEFHAEHARLLAEMDEPSAAREEFERARRALEQSVGREHIDYAEALLGRGLADLRQGSAREARKSLEDALGTFERQVGGRHPAYVQTLESLASTYYALDDPGRAFEAGSKADDGTRQISRAVLATLPEQQALARAALPRQGRDVALTVALRPDARPDQQRAAYDQLIRSRAVVFDEIASRNRFHGVADGSRTAELVESLREARTRLANLFVLGPGGDPGRYAGLMDEARERIEALETELARSSAKFRAERAGREFGVEDLRAALPPGSACVSFIRYARQQESGLAFTESYAAVIQRAGVDPLAFVDLGPAAPLDRAIDAWRAELRWENVGRSGALERVHDHGIRLRRALWDPLVSHLGPARQLFLVPDGAVHLVSFAALPAGETSFLLEDERQLHYLTAERDLARETDPATGSGLLAVGNPAFGRREGPPDPSPTRGAQQVCDSFRSRRPFDDLPASADEARAVESIWRSRTGPGSLVLTAGEATETAVQRHAPGREVLHFATHGFFLGEECAADGPLRGIGGLVPLPPVGAAETRRSVNPMLLSGLVLAHANERDPDGGSGDDGILTAVEVSALPLSGTRLAVLSACRSGSGSVTGEGLFGLRRAFLLAGARTVVTSLWDIEDQAARQWIEEFYAQHLTDGKSIPQAMRAASLAVLEKRRAGEQATHPFYWGGWIAVGQTDGSQKGDGR